MVCVEGQKHCDDSAVRSPNRRCSCELMQVEKKSLWVAAEFYSWRARATAGGTDQRRCLSARQTRGWTIWPHNVWIGE